MTELKTLTASELLRQESKPEPPEHAYRRGYCDGWIMAISAMYDLMFEGRCSRQAAFDICDEHWRSRLYRWLHSDCTRFIPPPLCGDDEVPF